MSLWGNKDSLDNLTGTITINLATETVTGSGTTFVTAGISTGDILVVGAGATGGGGTTLVDDDDADDEDDALLV